MKPPTRPAPTQPGIRRGPARWLLVVAGVLLAGLGLIGVALPILPTTPFLLAASACFLRSSPRLHERLLRNRAFGPYLAEWQESRTVPAAAKRRAYALAVVTFSLSIWLVDHTALRWMLAAIGVALVVFLMRLPTSTARDASTDAPRAGNAVSARRLR